MTDKSGKEVIKSIEEKMGFSPYVLEVLHDLDEDFVKKYNHCDRALLTDGALSAKTKILMGLAVVASKQCESCVMAQMRSAIHNGATKEEIMETMEVISITSGAPAVAACRNALNTLLNKKNEGEACSVRKSC